MWITRDAARATLVLALTLALGTQADARGRTPNQRVRTYGLTGNDLAAARKVSGRITNDMVTRIKKLSTIKGSGFERYGQGDVKIIQRRNLVNQVLESDSSSTLRSLGKGTWLRKDIDALRRVERTDAMRNPGKRSGFATLDEVWLRVDGASKINDKRNTGFLKGLMKGKQSYFAVDNARCSTGILGKIRSPELRARTMVDMLLQFREPEDKNRKFEELRVGGTGIQAVMEMRNNAKRVTPLRGSAAKEREYALMRALVTSHPRTSSNAVLEARNVMGELRRHSWQLVYGDKAIQQGFKISPYEAIHRNYSTQTPKVIKAFVSKTVFSGGEPETFCTLVDVMNTARGGKQAEASKLLSGALKHDADIAAKLRTHQRKSSVSRKPLAEQVESFLVSRCKGKLDSQSYLSAMGDLVGDQSMHLRKAGVHDARGNYGKKLTLVAQVYRAVCNSMPTARTLGEQLHSAKGARLTVASVIDKLERGAPRAKTQASIARARRALRLEFSRQKKGYVRLGLWKLDRQLDTLHANLLGSSVEAIGDCSSRKQQVEALSALRSALHGAMASGMHQIRDLKDPRPRSGPTLRSALREVKQIEKGFAAGTVPLARYQEVMARANQAITRTTEDVQTYLESRIPHVEQGKLVPNPQFFDNFIKESPLHYAAAITQQGSAVGLRRTMSREQIVNPTGVTALNRVGRVVFDRVLVGDSLEALMTKGAGINDFGMVRTVGRGQVDEKKMVRMGGVMANFPGGFSHAANFSRGAGMAALANPSVNGTWLKFAKHVGQDKLYYDDRGGKLVMMPLREALRKGLVKQGEVGKLRPGNNRLIRYHSWSEKTRRWRVAGKHEVKVNPERRTNVIDIYKRADKVRGVSKLVMSFEEIGRLGTDARALAGEKGLVLGMMSVDPRLKHRTPPGSVVTTLGVKRLLQASGALGAWMAVWDKDPAVRKINDKNFMRSRFYTDGSYRRKTCKQMTTLVEQKLRAYLLNADGTPTKHGRAWMRMLRGSNKKLRRTPVWIARSAFTTEDRPFKSSAGQYDSFPKLTTDRANLEGIIGVVRSAWNKAAVENSVTEQYNLRHAWPTIPIMKSVDAVKSGVFLTRDSETGYRRTLSYQAVKGFGGGVEGGITEEGKLTRAGLQLTKPMAGAKRPLLTKRLSKELFSAGMALERLFNKVVEPGKGYPLDVEWVVDRADRKLYLVQARTVPIN